MDKWKDIVNNLTHTAGFQKFSNLQVESNLPVAQKASMVVGTSGTVTGVIDLMGYQSLHEVNNFDLVTENLKSRSPASGNLSDEITFQNRILIDYAESVGNRVSRLIISVMISKINQEILRSLKLVDMLSQEIKRIDLWSM